MQRSLTQLSRQPLILGQQHPRPSILGSPHEKGAELREAAQRPDLLTAGSASPRPALTDAVPRHRPAEQSDRRHARIRLDTQVLLSPRSVFHFVLSFCYSPPFQEEKQDPALPPSQPHLLRLTTRSLLHSKRLHPVPLYQTTGLSPKRYFSSCHTLSSDRSLEGK